MEFSSYTFVLFFLPATLLGAAILMRWGTQSARMLFLTAASILFYAWWDWRFVSVLALSLIVNYVIGLSLARRAHKPVLILGIGFNLLLLGYFKYVDFFITNVNAVLGADIGVLSIVLPLGISFFTFQQIAYLADVRRGAPVARDFLSQALFVTFFPQLIPGPIAHSTALPPHVPTLGPSAPRASDLAPGCQTFVTGRLRNTVLD